MFYTRIMLDTSSSPGVDNTKNIQGVRRKGPNIMGLQAENKEFQEKQVEYTGCHEVIARIYWEKRLNIQGVMRKNAEYTAITVYTEYHVS